MVLYHGITTWHILECWVHKLTYHKEDRAILILPDFIKDKFTNIKETFPEKIFEIVLIEYRKVNYKLEKSEIEDSFNSLVAKTKISEYIDECNEIYVAGAQYMFSHYLIKKGIEFHFIEEAPGRLSTSEVVVNNVKNINLVQHDIAMEDGMFTGHNKLVKSIICNVAAQTDVDMQELSLKIVDFDVIQALQRLSKDDLEYIKEYFNVPKVIFKDKATLVLTQHFANLNMTNYVEQALLYQMTIDYFADNDSVYIKPHPDDLMNYKVELEECELITGCFPSELLHVMSETKPQKLLAISSSSIFNLKKYYGEIIGFNEEYISSFYLNHQYYLIAKVMKQLCLNEIISIGINSVQLKNMLNIIGKTEVKVSNIPKGREGKLWFVDDLEFEKRLANNSFDNRENDVFVFLDPISWIDFAGSKEECIRYGFCKTINIRAIDEAEYNEEGVFYVYFYCQNPEVRKDILNMHYVKKLINSGIETTVPKLDNKDLEIAVLKGILKATERRLQAYLEQSEKKNESEILRSK